MLPARVYSFHMWNQNVCESEMFRLLCVFALPLDYAQTKQNCEQRPEMIIHGQNYTIANSRLVVVVFFSIHASSFLGGKTSENVRIGGMRMSEQ